MTSITLPELAGMLADAGATMSASECHGALCGALCVHEYYPVDRWLRHVLPEQARVVPAERFSIVVAETTASLRGDLMQFQLLLPDDDVPIAERTDSLGEWCEGFLYGLSSGALGRDRRLPGDVAEILRDFAQISRAAPDDGDSDEENETAYAELVEFVKVSAQLVHDELAELREGDRAG